MESVNSYKGRRLAKMNRKICAVQFQCAPYRDNTYEYFNSVSTDRIEMQVFGGETETHPEWNYKTDIQKNIHNVKSGKFDPSIKTFLQKERWDAICVAGYNAPTAKYAIIYGLIHSIPIIMQADTVKSGKLSWVKRILYKLFSSIWVPGNAAKSYFMNNGVSENKIFLGEYTYDYEAIKKYVDNVDKSTLRKQMNIGSEDFVFLFVGKLIIDRRIGNLVEAINMISTKKIKFVIIGDGDDINKLEYIKDKSCVIHIPSVPLSDLYDFYAVSDAYIHPGKEPFSCAVMQAIAAGLPVITTEEVGASKDFSLDFANNIIIPFDNVNELYNAINEVYSEREVMKMEAKKAQKYYCSERSIPFAASQLQEAINISCKK